MIIYLKPRCKFLLIRLVIISDLNTIYQMFLNYPDIEINTIKSIAFKLRESLKKDSRNSKGSDYSDIRKSEGTTMVSSFVVDDEIIYRLEQLYLKYKKNINLKDSKEFLTTIIKLKNYKNK
jgi:hypothetical protein